MRVQQINFKPTEEQYAFLQARKQVGRPINETIQTALGLYMHHLANPRNHADRDRA